MSSLATSDDTTFMQPQKDKWFLRCMLQILGTYEEDIYMYIKGLLQILRACCKDGPSTDGLLLCSKHNLHSQALSPFGRQMRGSLGTRLPGASTFVQIQRVQVFTLQVYGPNTYALLGWPDTY